MAGNMHMTNITNTNCIAIASYVHFVFQELELDQVTYDNTVIAIGKYLQYKHTYT